MRPERGSRRTALIDSCIERPLQRVDRDRPSISPLLLALANRCIQSGRIDASLFPSQRPHAAAAADVINAARVVASYNELANRHNACAFNQDAKDRIELIIRIVHHYCANNL